MHAAQAKEALRRKMRDQLTAMAPEDLAARSLLLGDVLRNGGWLEAGATVALFGGIPGEPDLLSLIPWLLERQSVPVIFGFKNGQLIPQRINDPKELHRGIFGVWIPPADAAIVPVAQLDVILTPGLAFSRDGMRLGRGRGHFDRLFAQPEVTATRLGVCWNFQLVQEVPSEIHDARMQSVMTEYGLVTA
ncbi:MAG: 5-formyltetrahydrofolate cyclo-ligase [Verrucomicrobiaceae bacterium]|nr:5-formyltetrahydrofolate cyclo-ligase [Verrucomicrobiaceae bacterium]